MNIRQHKADTNKSLFAPEARSSAIQQQIEFLQHCIANNVALDSYLDSIGRGYDDLSYMINLEKTKNGTQKILELTNFSQKNNQIPVVSFFAGAGGLDLGFEAAGFEHAVLVEKNSLFCETIRHNRPQWSVESADVSQKDQMIELLSRYIGRGQYFDGIFIGGPPCQSFSIAANQRFSKEDENFKRTGFLHEKNGNLLFDYIELIAYFKPRAFLIENVTGLMDVDSGEQLKKAYRILEEAGYTMNQPMVIKADRYSVPQQRVRLFVVGSRKGKIYQPIIPKNHPLAVASVFEKTLIGVDNHITRAHSAESVLRYMMLDYGCRDQKGRVDRLNPNDPSKTVIAGGSSGGGRSHLHPHIPRTLSVRECARIQTFPDDYVFLGAVARQFTQVGNAVPPILAAQLANSLLSLL